MDEIDGIIGWAVEIPLLFQIIMIEDIISSVGHKCNEIQNITLLLKIVRNYLGTWLIGGCCQMGWNIFHVQTGG